MTWIMSIPLYNKDTLSGKKVDTKQLNFYGFTDEGLDIRDIDLESSLDFLASESFIVIGIKDMTILTMP